MVDRPLFNFNAELYQEVTKRSSPLCLSLSTKKMLREKKAQQFLLVGHFVEVYVGSRQVMGTSILPVEVDQLN